ncbi:hypothetical protein ACHAWC_008837 [Mediolabrus comicus]
MDLSHISSQSAAAAEAETIRRLRREVLGLTLTVDALKKGSKEWVLLSSKLEVAREELDAVLEDQHLFRSISSSGDSEKISPTVSQVDKVKALTPPLVASDTVQQLENKLSRAKKYSLEWFEIKKQIDVETKKNRNLNASINPNKNFGRSKSCPKTMGSLPTKHIDAKETRNKRNGLIKFPSTGRTVSQIQTPTIMTIKDGRRTQSLKDQLLQSPKYSLEWFELKRRISRRSSNNSCSSRSSSSTNGECSSPENNMTPQHVNDVPCEKSQLSSSDDEDVPVISTTAPRSESSLDPDLSLKSEPQELALTTTAVEQTSETRNDLDTDLTESSKDDTDDKAAQHTQKLNELLQRVPKYSTEYYQTKKIIKLMQTNNNSR